MNFKNNESENNLIHPNYVLQNDLQLTGFVEQTPNFSANAEYPPNIQNFQNISIITNQNHDNSEASILDKNNYTEHSPSNKNEIRINRSQNREFTVRSGTDNSRKTRIFKSNANGDNDIFSVQPVIVKKVNLLKQKLLSLINHKYMELFLNLLIFYALFADDFRTIFLPKSIDYTFDTMTMICIIVFTFEISISVYVKTTYFNSFFFYLDIISTLTLFFNISYVYEEVFYRSAFANRAQIARASRASQIGTRAGRIVKFFNFDKFFNFFRMKIQKRERKSGDSPQTDMMASIKSIKSTPKKDSAGGALSFAKIVKRLSRVAHFTFSSTAAEDIKEKSEKLKESRVGKKLSELTTKRVMVLVLLLFLFVPVFSSDYHFTKDLSYEYGMKTILNMVENEIDITNINRTLNDFVKIQDISNHPIISIDIPPVNLSLNLMDLNDFRKGEYDIIEYDYNNTIISGYFSKRIPNTRDSTINIFRTAFVCFLLLISAMIFSKDANDLALRPIERMIIKVNKIANDPLIALDESFKKVKGENSETIIIENAIIKIGTLLALGFGEAGSGIIASNIMKGKSGTVDPLLPGKKHFAVFGFCDIRNFTDVTEILEEEVMIFVNTIASVVHKTVDKYVGNTNKNIGDAFLMVWKLPDSELEIIEEVMKVKRTKIVKNLCDLSIISYLKVIAHINSKEKILDYSYNLKILERLPNYKVKMGFGLHLGWGIEGAIGSIFKIDASYLSPNVNIASRLEACTKQYGVYLLISDILQGFCSKKMKNYLRQIDIVTVKGSVKPMGLFTVDFSLNALKNFVKIGKTQKINHKENKKELISLLENDEIKAISLLENDQQLMSMINYNDLNNFKISFHNGFNYYIEGKWVESRLKFLEGKHYKNDDGPTLTLLNYMEKFNYESPKNWKGFRELTEK